ncbi:MAG: oligopeptide/dipeptide ABC transporter ATP-binding protein [Acetobacteraceae bacterium]
MAEAIFEQLAQLRPHFYPIPFRQQNRSPVDGVRQHDIVGIDPMPLPKEALLELYGKCHQQLHRGNVRKLLSSDTPIDLHTNFPEIISWAQRVNDQLACRLIAISEKNLIFCILRNMDNNQKVQVGTMEKRAFPPNFPCSGLSDTPRHPYTKALLRAIPDPGPNRSLPRDLPRGEVPGAAWPPLARAFHPRCPKAFAPCGWEPRDLIELLELRWSRMAEADHAKERVMIGHSVIRTANKPGWRLAAARGANGERLLAFLQRIHTENSAEPFWTGVQAMRTGTDFVEITWRASRTPHLLASGDVKVACHLYDGTAIDAEYSA